MIEGYSFGSMVVDGTEYTSDLVIFPGGRVQPSWWREEGHGLSLDDLAELVAAEPEIIVAGTGASGLMVPDPALAGALKRKGIELRAAPTGEALRIFNDLSAERRVGGCFHLTC